MQAFGVGGAFRAADRAGERDGRDAALANHDAAVDQPQ